MAVSGWGSAGAPMPPQELHEWALKRASLCMFMNVSLWIHTVNHHFFLSRDPKPFLLHYPLCTDKKHLDNHKHFSFLEMGMNCCRYFLEYFKSQQRQT